MEVLFCAWVSSVSITERVGYGCELWKSVKSAAGWGRDGPFFGYGRDVLRCSCPYGWSLNEFGFFVGPLQEGKGTTDLVGGSGCMKGKRVTSMLPSF